jgi:hypothetical protein
MNKRDRQLQKLYDKLNENRGIFRKEKPKNINKKPKQKKIKVEKKIEDREKLLYLPYMELLKLNQWKEKRIQILKRDNYKCIVCNSAKKLHVHHRLYESFKLPWEYDNSYLVSLCEKCHKSIHSSSINMKIMEYEISDKIGEPNNKKNKFV